MATSMQLSLLGALTQTVRALKKEFCNPYRPELHYMRGAGPKWRESHGLRLTPVAVRRRPAGISHFLTR